MTHDSNNNAPILRLIFANRLAIRISIRNDGTGRAVADSREVRGWKSRIDERFENSARAQTRKLPIVLKDLAVIDRNIVRVTLDSYIDGGPHLF